MSDKLKPCPRCGDHINTTIRTIVEQNSNFQNQNFDYEVVCKRCHMSSGLAFSKESAIKAWNTFPRHLNWTPKIPTEPGWYFIKYKGKITICHATYPKGSSYMTYRVIGSPDAWNMKYADEWAGPILEPIENK